MQKGLKKYFVNMDEYLCSLGLYRKMLARDASSLFRAVSEQLYYSQNYHHRIRQECADYMRTNRCNFEPVSNCAEKYNANSVEGSFEKYLQRLEDPMVTLCCSINGHYDIVYPRSYPASAALCQCEYCALIGGEAMEAFRVGGRRYRNSPSVCSDADFGYDTPEDRREESDPGGAVEEKRAVPEDTKPPAEAPPPSRLSLPYKVMKSLDGEVYRNLEFDMWQDTCKEMQKTDYMVFAGRQYFLGDKCQVRLEPKGKFYHAFIQELGTHASAVTVFIEELGEKHLVQLTDLKPVNPVPAWNVAAPSRKGDMGKIHFLSSPVFLLLSCLPAPHLSSCSSPVLLLLTCLPAPQLSSWSSPVFLLLTCLPAPHLSSCSSPVLTCLPSPNLSPHLSSPCRPRPAPPPRHRYFRKSRGGMKGAELLMPPPSYGGPAPSSLPPASSPQVTPAPPPSQQGP
ncbi:hypothetical protein F7725_004429 [Dissostichus mawsoni]|uniref:ubiquitinyl hydrolase 1 n=1 Tax=Dissostichus mawsoni TaxID=36200 RepID=A0A7J5XIQ0_DISMA|nr:hypothetical protein F7725_004429 [Dissostichus mawsoni]